LNSPNIFQIKSKTTAKTVIYIDERIIVLS
jgi:hypothetical protein